MSDNFKSERNSRMDYENIYVKNFLISEEQEEFKFNEMTKFKTFIGFKSGNIPSNWINTINIGIDSIIQFISIILPIDIKNSKSKYICYQSK